MASIAVQTSSATRAEEPWFLRSKAPVFWPSSDALTLSEEQFYAYLETELDAVRRDGSSTPLPFHSRGDNDADPTPDIPETSDGAPIEAKTGSAVDSNLPPCLESLLDDNKMLTANGDVAYKSSEAALVDLFYELEDSVCGERLELLLDRAWQRDPVATLKIIFNARSIHLGKASRPTFYKCAGWLAQHHPLTLIANLRWLSRPVIEIKDRNKNRGKAGEAGEDDMVLVEPVRGGEAGDEEKKKEGGKGEGKDDDVTRFDVQFGVAHGYWKDLLNLLALSANGALHVFADPERELKIEQHPKRPPRFKRKYGEVDDDIDEVADQEEEEENDDDEDDDKNDEMKIDNSPVEKRSAETRTKSKEDRYRAALAAWEEQPVHRALHLAVARLFAEQLQADLALLRGGSRKAKAGISLCAKWAPSLDRSHDRRTRVASSVAEIMHPQRELASKTTVSKSGDAQADRETYLRYARDAYRKDVSALRAHLQVVERDITAKRYATIDYARIPSVAMNRYAALFARRDGQRFAAYIDEVASGQARISGATLLPGDLVAQALACRADRPRTSVAHKIKARVLDAQWRALVRRVKESGALDSCLAVCDVSGSMFGPALSDGTVPVHHSIGLSLLMAEVASEPFAGTFVTFSSEPQAVQLDPSRSLKEKVQAVQRAAWGFTTNFVAVFERLILPVAKQQGLTQEQMVKRVFVFSDMHFDQAETGAERWTTSFERVEARFREAGYEMPQLVFWNLASGAQTTRGAGANRAAPPKPVVARQEGTALVSGYSPGLLRALMEQGSFEDAEQDEETIIVTQDGGQEDDEGFAVVSKTTAGRAKREANPLDVVMRVIGHKAYDMLKVVD